MVIGSSPHHFQNINKYTQKRRRSYYYIIYIIFNSLNKNVIIINTQTILHSTHYHKVTIQQQF